MLAYYLNKKNHKVTVHHIQKLCGFLNFLCRCVIPGRAFLRHTYSLVSSKLLPHHHVKLTQEIRMDLNVWSKFLQSPDIFCRPFIDFTELDVNDIYMYSDASRNFNLRFSALCNNEWTYGIRERDFMERHQPCIEFLELYGVTVAVLNWIWKFQNKRIYLFTDNQSVMRMINKSSSSYKQCMALIRIITLEGLMFVFLQNT